MNKLLPLLAFSILLLVPVGVQNALANHPPILACDPPGDLITDPSVITPFGNPFCLHSPEFFLNAQTCQPPYELLPVENSQTGEPVYFACISPVQQIQDPTHPGQCQDKATLVGNHCVPDLNQVCGSGTIPQNMMCVAQQMGSMIGGVLLDINTVSLLVASIGVNPVITGLVGITLAGVAGQAIWFVHRRRKNSS